MDGCQNYEVEVSVYCLSFNHEKYIRYTLEGFVNQQTNFSYEVLVYDDASTDNTREIIREYADRYPKIIVPIFQTENQYSKGIDVTQKFVFPRLRGRYICSCEGDDYWCDPYKLQKQYEALESHPNCSLCTHIVKCCNEDGSPNARVIPERWYKIRESNVIGKEELAQCFWERGGYPFHTSSYFYRSEIRNINFDHPRDIGILRKCLVIGDCYFINEAMSVRRLWSVGNWNSRLLEQGVEGRYQLMLHDIVADDCFDKLTEYVWHPYIVKQKLLSLLAYAQYHPYEIKMILKHSGIHPLKLRRISIRFKVMIFLKYSLFMACPECYGKFQSSYQFLRGWHNRLFHR